MVRVVSTLYVTRRAIYSFDGIMYTEILRSNRKRLVLVITPVENFMQSSCHLVVGTGFD